MPQCFPCFPPRGTLGRRRLIASAGGWPVPVDLPKCCFDGVYSMSRAQSKMREFAERLIAHETRLNSSKTKTAAVMACEKSRPHLATLMGNAGFSALLSRALAMSISDIGWLCVIHVKADGSLKGLDEVGSEISFEDTVEGGVVLMTHMLRLLVAFIGENLTVRLMREIWPTVSFDDSISANGGKK